MMRARPRPGRSHPGWTQTTGNATSTGCSMECRARSTQPARASSLTCSLMTVRPPTARGVPNADDKPPPMWLPRRPETQWPRSAMTLVVECGRGTDSKVMQRLRGTRARRSSRGRSGNRREPPAPDTGSYAGQRGGTAASLCPASCGGACGCRWLFGRPVLSRQFLPFVDAGRLRPLLRGLASGVTAAAEVKQVWPRVAYRWDWDSPAANADAFEFAWSAAGGPLAPHQATCSRGCGTLAGHSAR